MNLKKSDGYILLEIIVAAAILAGGLLVVLRSLSEAARAEAALEKRSAALILLREKIIDLGKPALEGGAASRTAVNISGGDFEERAPGYSWSAEPVDDPDLKGAWALVKVTWTHAGRVQSVEARTLLKPAKTAEDGNNAEMQVPDKLKKENTEY